MCKAILALLAAVATAGSAGAQGFVPFDLLEINAAPGPLDPGLPFVFVPATSAPAESSGVSVVDLNDDGFLDLLLCGTEGRPNELYVNSGDGGFVESAAAYGIQETSRRRSQGLFLDLENDGDLDLLTTGYPGLINDVIDLDLFSLFRNDGPPSFGFTDITAASGGFALAPTADDTTLGMQGGAAAADHDRDGYVDVFVTWWNNNEHLEDYGHDQARLWHNVPNPAPDGGQPDYTPRLLVDATLEAGLESVGEAQNLQPTFTDFNRDGWPDLHIDVESGPDELRLNNGDGTFGSNVATQVGMNFNVAPPGTGGNEMGTATADYDNDGDLDLYLTNQSLAYGPKKQDAFYLNDSDLSIGGFGLKFVNIGLVTGTDGTFGIGWGAVFVDMDNDGDKDLLSTRGLGLLTAPNYLWINHFPAFEPDGVTVALSDESACVPEYSDLSTTWDNARALVAFDFDNDGDLDVVYTRSPVLNQPLIGNSQVAFFLNTLSNGNPSLQVSLVEANGSRNTLGALVWLRTGGVGGAVQMSEVAAGSSYISQEPDRLHFGLGAAAAADWLAIRWFDGQQQVVRADGGPPLAGFLTVNRAAHDDSGDLDADGDADPSDLLLLQVGIGNPAGVDAAVPDWPWRQTADLDGNGLVDSRDQDELHTLLSAQFTDLGNGLAGTNGVPTLEGLGPLTAGSAVSLTLDDAVASATWWLIIGFSQFDAPFKGGVLVPAPNLLLGPLPTLGGSLPLLDTWPPGLPPGLALYFQGWISDAAGPKGFAATNGLKALLP